MKRTVFITGASSGFGAGCARKFAEQGDRLVLTARRADKLQGLAGELANTTDVFAAGLDVRNRDAVRQAKPQLPTES